MIEESANGLDGIADPLIGPDDVGDESIRRSAALSRFHHLAVSVSVHIPPTERVTVDRFGPTIRTKSVRFDLGVIRGRSCSLGLNS